MSVCIVFPPAAGRLQMYPSSECVARAKSPSGLLRLLGIYLALLIVRRAPHRQVRCSLSIQLLSSSFPFKGCHVRPAPPGSFERRLFCRMPVRRRIQPAGLPRNTYAAMHIGGGGDHRFCTGFRPVGRGLFLSRLSFMPFFLRGLPAARRGFFSQISI